jgi:hypothetical protein
VAKARAAWCRDVADVLLHTILSTSNSQRMRATAIQALSTLGQLQDVHVGVWLAQALEGLQPPLMARRFVPVKVRGWWPVCWAVGHAGMGMQQAARTVTVVHTSQLAVF